MQELAVRIYDRSPATGRAAGSLGQTIEPPSISYSSVRSGQITGHI
jgi:hypothetical protein